MHEDADENTFIFSNMYFCYWNTLYDTFLARVILTPPPPLPLEIPIRINMTTPNHFADAVIG